MRLEEMPAIRRELIKEAEAVHKAGGNHPFDNARPWHHAWLRATSEAADQFWKDELEEPAQAVRLELRRLGEVVDGDAPVTASSATSSGTPVVPTVTSNADVAAPPPAYKRPADEEWSWPLRVNKKKKSLCPGFQAGSCHNSHPGSPVCPADSAARHQCAICLENNHGAAQCPNKGKGDTVGITKKTKTTKPRRGKVIKKGKH